MIENKAQSNLILFVCLPAHLSFNAEMVLFFFEGMKNVQSPDLIGLIFREIDC